MDNKKNKIKKPHYLSAHPIRDRLRESAHRRLWQSNSGFLCNSPTHNFGQRYKNCKM